MKSNLPPGGMFTPAEHTLFSLKDASVLFLPCSGRVQFENLGPASNEGPRDVKNSSFKDTQTNYLCVSSNNQAAEGKIEGTREKDPTDFVNYSSEMRC